MIVYGDLAFKEVIKVNLGHKGGGFINQLDHVLMRGGRHQKYIKHEEKAV